jgi:hypothetical protein
LQIQKLSFGIRDLSGVETLEYEYTKNLAQGIGYNVCGGQQFIYPVRSNFCFDINQYFINNPLSEIRVRQEHNYFVPIITDENGNQLLPFFSHSVLNIIPNISILDNWVVTEIQFRNISGNQFKIKLILKRQKTTFFQPEQLDEYVQIGTTTFQNNTVYQYVMRANAYVKKFPKQILTRTIGSYRSHYFPLSTNKRIHKTSLSAKGVLMALSGLDVDTQLLNNCVFVHNSEISGGSKGREDFKIAHKTSLKKMLSDICNFFNAKWDIIDNKLVIRNIDYWLGKDSVMPKNILNKNKKTYKYLKTPKFEILELTPNPEQIEQGGLPIEYATSGEGESESISVGFGNSIDKVIEDEVNSGLTLIKLKQVEPFAIYKDGAIQSIEVLEPETNVGLITGLTYINEPLTATRIMSNYFKSFRKAKKGKLNLVDTDFVAFNKEQEILLTEEPKYLQRIETDLGVYRVFSYSYDKINKLYKCVCYG